MEEISRNAKRREMKRLYKQSQYRIPQLIQAGHLSREDGERRLRVQRAILQDLTQGAPGMRSPRKE